MKAIATMPARDLLELNYRVAYHIAQNALEEGSTPRTIRANTFKMEAFERGLKNRPEEPLQLRASQRLTKWLGIEDALAGRSENPPCDLFIENEPFPWEYAGELADDLSRSFACEDDDLGSRYSNC